MCEIVLFTYLSAIGRAVGGLEEEVWIASFTANIKTDTGHLSLKIDNQFTIYSHKILFMEVRSF
jgi:hypothetical protein